MEKQTNEVFENGVADYVVHLQKHADKRGAFPPMILSENNKRYVKIICHDPRTKGNSVIAFIVMSDKDAKFKKGDILKAASWRGPAKNFARGNVFDSNSYIEHTTYGI